MQKHNRILVMKACLPFLLFFTHLTSYGQITKVRGFIFDKETEKPVPFAAVSFKNTTVGTISAYNGEYFLETRKPVDTLIISCVGYITLHIAINQNHFLELNVNLEPDNIALDEVIITPGENPAHALLKKIHEHKKINHPDNIPAYSCEIYNKVQVDMNNFGDKLKDRKYMKQFDFIFEHVDTSSLTGKEYLPVMITETLSDFYYTSHPKKQQEFIKASKISGFSNESISEYTGKMYQQLEIYDNFITVFEPGFVSPIADFGLLYYKYYLVDSMYVDNQFCYKISFHPKRKQERTFSGYFTVADSTYAIVEAQLRISKDANINFINDYLAILHYSFINDSIYFLTKEKHVVDFTLTDKSFGFFGNKTTTYQNIMINPEIPEKVKKAKVNIIVNDDAIEKDDYYWEQNRHEKLTRKEENIYSMVDSVKEVPLFKHAYDLVWLLTDYYYVIGPFEYGPYYTTFSNNYIEGNRIRIGGRTSNAFSTKLMISGHVAYGFKDDKYKYGLGALYMFGKNPRRSLGLSYEKDRRQLGQTNNAFQEDNIMVSMLRRTPNETLTMVEEYKAFYEHEWFQGLTNKITLTHQKIFPLEAVPFNTGDTQTGLTSFPNLTNAEITLNTRIAIEEKFLMGEFERISLGSEYPILDTWISLGISDVFGSDYNYVKMRFEISDKVEINPVGYLRYIIDGGKIWGKLPYPLLELHKGNETYAYDILAFNMMNYFEFISDTYVSWITEHHFQGFFLNRIPLLRKLDWREVVTARGVVGKLSNENLNMWNFPVGLNELNKPYMEAGIGIENIFKFFRIDALWRLSYLDNPGIQKFGLRLGLQVIL